MTKQKQIEEIKNLVSQKVDDTIFFVKYQSECYRIDRHGIFKSNDSDPKGLKDFSDKCQDAAHFEGLKQHLFSRLTGDKTNPHWGFAWLKEVQDWHDTPDHKTVPGTIYILIPE